MVPESADSTPFTSQAPAIRSRFAQSKGPLVVKTGVNSGKSTIIGGSNLLSAGFRSLPLCEENQCIHTPWGNVNLLFAMFLLGDASGPNRSRKPPIIVDLREFAP